MRRGVALGISNHDFLVSISGSIFEHFWRVLGSTWTNKFRAWFRNPFFEAWELSWMLLSGLLGILELSVWEGLKVEQLATVLCENNFSEKFWTVGQWQDGVFRGVKGVNVDGEVPVRLKDGWK